MSTNIKAIYPHLGNVIDHRVNPFDLNPKEISTPIINQQLKSVVCFMDKAHLKLTITGEYELQYKKLSDCFYKVKDTIAQVGENEAFSDEPVAPYGSGCYLGNRYVASAGHCAIDNILNSVRVVFGFKMLDKFTCKTTYAPADIYGIEKVVLQKNQDLAPDYAVFKLDREVTGDHPPTDVGFTAVLEDLKPYMIGHPLGQPVKVTQNATVKSIKDQIFEIECDAFKGNSGSPVYAITQNRSKVFGILTSGNSDFDVDLDYQGTGNKRLVYHKVTQEDINKQGYEICQKTDFLKPYAPDDGLNFFGHCPKLSCEAYGEKVFIHQGFGSFQIEEKIHHSNFTCCNTNAGESVEGIVLKNCHYSYEGKDSNRTLFTQENQEIQGSLELDLREWKYFKARVWN